MNTGSGNVLHSPPLSGVHKKKTCLIALRMRLHPSLQHSPGGSAFWRETSSPFGS